MTTVDVALWICVRICIYLNIEYTRTCFCIGKMRIKHSTFRHAWCLMVSVFPDGLDDYDVSTKACINLGPRYLRRRTEPRSKLRDPQTMQNWLHRWTSRGPPLWMQKWFKLSWWDFSVHGWPGWTCHLPQDPQVNKHITQIWDLGTRYLTLEGLEGIDPKNM